MPVRKKAYVLFDGVLSAKELLLRYHRCLLFNSLRFDNTLNNDPQLLKGLYAQQQLES